VPPKNWLELGLDAIAVGNMANEPAENSAAKTSPYGVHLP
jgi:hypothetical protein